jgi:redox-sensitive bicupin YhaK (pirin superfamily)
MIQLRKSADRGKSQNNWLDSAHTFSFSDYHDPNFMGFGALRVINEDVVQPGMGFGQHAHRNMEIISYVIDGALAHKDSIGTGSVIQPGEIQSMTAGSGIEHSEFNESKKQPVHFLQIWIVPAQLNLKPAYQQIKIQKVMNEWVLIGSPEGGTAAITIHQDVRLYLAFMQSNHTLHYEFNAGRMGWLQLIKGSIRLNGNVMQAGDGAAILNEAVTVDCVNEAEFLFFDLAESA